MARNSYGIAKRSIWYVLRTLIITAAIVAMCLGVFIEGLHVSNLYILVTEGMQKRAEAILKYGKTGGHVDLTPYFTEEGINNDKELTTGEYANFTVASYDYRVDVKDIFVLPWSVRANMTVDARLAAINAASDFADSETEQPLPEWEAGRYQVVFKKVGSRWYINSITLLQKDPETEVKPTPDMSLMDSKHNNG